MGTDCVFTRARGLFSRQHGEIGFDPIQFYTELLAVGALLGLWLRAIRPRPEPAPPPGAS